jgi:hypothetical protein
MDADALLARVPTTEQAAVRTRWRDLRGRIVTEARTAPEDREGLCKEKEAWLGRWCALWVRFLLVWRETGLTVVALGQVELSALCKDSEDVGRPISPFDDFEGDELDCVRAGLVLQKSWAAAPVDVRTADGEVPIATLPVSRSSSPVGVASSGDGEKAAGCEAGDDDSGKDVDALEPMKTRSSGQKRARAEVRVGPSCACALGADRSSPPPPRGSLCRLPKWPSFTIRPALAVYGWGRPARGGQGKNASCARRGTGVAL